MFNLMSNLKTINSATRTVVAVAVLGFVGWGGFLGYDKYVKPGLEAEAAKAEAAQAKADLALIEKELEVKAEELEKVTHENAELVTSLTLLKIDSRKANVEVLEKAIDEDGKPYLQVRFTEFDANGEPVGASRDFTLAGTQLFVDCWTVSFKDKYIEKADALRSASLCVFKRIYGDGDKPEEGFKLDQQSEDPNAPPAIYKSPEQNKFESQIWQDFWAFANDGDKQDLFGIRNTQGKAVYVNAEQGKTYEVVVRASGEMSFRPVSTRSNNSDN